MRITKIRGPVNAAWRIDGLVIPNPFLTAKYKIQTWLLLRRWRREAKAKGAR